MTGKDKATGGSDENRGKILDGLWRHHDFMRLCARQFGKAPRRQAVIGDPRPLGMEMPVDGEVSPVSEFLLDVLDGRPGLQSERVATQVHR